MEPLQAKLEGIETQLQNFIAEQKSRLLGIEQKIVGMRGGPGALTEGGGDGGPERKAPVDPFLDAPVLGPQHSLKHNLPPLKNGEQRQPLSWSKFLRGIAIGNWDNAEAERKALTTTTAGGGVLVPELLSAEAIDLARAQTVCIAAGARTIPIDTGAAVVPALTGDIVGAWQQGELTEIATAVPTIGPVNVAAKTFAAYLPAGISVQLFEDSPELLGEMLLRAFVRSFAVALDAAGLKGAGGSYEPLGLLNNNAVHQTSIAGGQITGDEISSAVKAIKLRNYLPNAYVFNPEAEAEIDQKKASTAGTYLGLPEGVTELDELVTSAADNDCYVGRWDKLAFFVRTPIQIEVSRIAGDAWKNLGISMRAYLRADVVALEPGAFQVLTNFGS